MANLKLAFSGIAVAVLIFNAASAQIGVGNVGPGPTVSPCRAFGTAAGTCIQGAGAGGTPSSITLTNGTGLPIAGITGLGSGVSTLLAGTSSGTVGLAGTASPTFTGTITGALSTWTSTAALMANWNSSNANGPYLALQESGSDHMYIGSAKATLGGNLADGAINVTGNNTLFLATNGGSRATVNSTALTLTGIQFNVSAMTQTSVAQSGTMCYNSVNGGVTYDATLGCLASLEELKVIKGPITGAISEIVALRPFWYSWKAGTPEAASGDLRVQPGLGAHATERVDSRLVGYGPDGKLRGVRYAQMIALLVAGMQDQQRDIISLKARMSNMDHK